MCKFPKWSILLDSCLYLQKYHHNICTVGKKTRQKNEPISRKFLIVSVWFLLMEKNLEINAIDITSFFKNFWVTVMRRRCCCLIIRNFFFCYNMHRKMTIAFILTLGVSVNFEHRHNLTENLSFWSYQLTMIVATKWKCGY